MQARNQLNANLLSWRYFSFIMESSKPGVN
uniref:Uncharacterized protein n=1 Tax=virus sp. ctqEG8 TaxID=2827998 RepID=A0A8S5RFD9_9VIRU|nr:MAG TPA: hypothetical protein [virus sp. ctqEG8]